MENKVIETFIPGPAGRLEAKYYKSKKKTSPIALILHPHPQYAELTLEVLVKVMVNLIMVKVS